MTIGTSHETTEPARFVPGQPDMWAFVLFEALVFNCYFIVYIISRTQSPDLFLESQTHLDLRVGVFRGTRLNFACVKARKKERAILLIA